MRGFAWILVVVGVVLSLGWQVWVTVEDNRLKGAMLTAAVQSQEGEYRSLAHDREALSKWPGVITGAAVSAFGVLLLAIRHPLATGGRA